MHSVGAIIVGSLVLSSTMEIEQSLTVKSNSRCAFQCCIVKNVNVVFPAVRPCCLEKNKQQNKMWKNAKLYFRRISAIHCDFLTSNQTSNVHSDGMVDFDITNIYFCFLHLSRIWLSCWHWPVRKITFSERNIFWGGAGQTWNLSKKITRPNFRAKEFYTLKMRKSGLLSPAINSKNASLSVIWPSFG